MSDGVDVRPYDPEEPADREALWSLKRAFETTLGAGTGGDAKRDRYESKLTDEYRRQWLAWVDRCLDAEDPVCLAEADGSVVGYVFLLPERLSFVWDGAVVNEVYVVPEHRGSGVGDALLERAVETARRQDLPLDRLLLDVDPDNERARSFYRRHDFEPWGEMVAKQL